MSTELSVSGNTPRAARSAPAESVIAEARGKVWEAVTSFTDRLGLLGVSPADMARMVDHAMGALAALPPDQLKNISVSSPPMFTAVATGYSAVYGQLSEQQMQSLRLNAKPDAAVTDGGAGKNGTGMWGAAGWLGASWVSAGGRNTGSSAQYAGMGSAGAVSGAALANYTTQYAGMGFDQSTIETLAAVKLDRATYDALSKDYSRSRIISGVRNAKDLGFAGGDEVTQVVEADQNFARALAVYHLATTPEVQAKEADHVRTIYDGLSPEAKKQADDVLKIYNDKNAERRLEIGNEATANLSDAQVTAVRQETGKVAALDANRAASAKSDAAAPATDAALADALDAFGVTAPKLAEKPAALPVTKLATATPDTGAAAEPKPPATEVAAAQRPKAATPSPT